MRLAGAKEYHRKTTGLHQMWATDASRFMVVDWGYYYLVTVTDDCSLFIPSANSGLAWRLQRDMTFDSFIELVQEAVDRTGMDRVPVTDRTRLLSDNGRAMYPGPSGSTWAWWASGIYWLLPSTLRPTGRWSGITRHQAGREPAAL